MTWLVFVAIFALVCMARLLAETIALHTCWLGHDMAETRLEGARYSEPRCLRCGGRGSR